MMKQITDKRQKGFTLMEVLISVTILSIGLLGIAGLQAKGLRYTQSSFYSSQATSLAYAIADSIHANPNGNYKLGDPLLGTFKSSTGPLAKNCLYISGPLTPPLCSPNQVATYDIYQWLNSFSLPQGEAQIVIPAPPLKPNYTITIRWDDNRDGAVTPAEEYKYTVRIGS